MSNVGDDFRSPIPWGPLATLLALVGGFYFYLKPLESPRPPAVSNSVDTLPGEQDVDARLWQDPLDATKRQQSHGPTSAPVHDVTSLRRQLAAALASESTKPPQVIVLAVMLSGGAYAENSESRLRARSAVLSGLALGGFVPRDEFHIGAIRVRWPTTVDEGSLSNNDFAQDPEPGEQSLSISFEWCDFVSQQVSPRFSGSFYSNEIRHVVVLWVQDEAFDNRPLLRLRMLRRAICGEGEPAVEQLSVGALERSASRVRFAVIGPRRSSMLQTMVEEVRYGAYIRWEEFWHYDGLLPLYSPTATVDDQLLRWRPDDEKGLPIPTQRLLVPLGFQLRRTIEQTGRWRARWWRSYSAAVSN